jgi:broad specificity phosphatase PhoE
MDPVESTRFLIVRHAESEWNATGRWQGHGDPPLSQRGRGQAALLAEQLRDEKVDVLICSDLGRARETAQYLARAWNLNAEPDARFRELDIGDWTGLTREEILERAGERLLRFDAEEPDVRPGGGESRREIRERVRGALAQVASERAGQRVALVTHLGVIRALIPGSRPENAEFTRITRETGASD